MLCCISNCHLLSTYPVPGRRNRSHSILTTSSAGVFIIPPTQFLLTSQRLRVVESLRLRSHSCLVKDPGMHDCGACVQLLCSAPFRLALISGSWHLIRDNFLHFAWTSPGLLDPPSTEFLPLQGTWLLIVPLGRVPCSSQPLLIQWEWHPYYLPTVASQESGTSSDFPSY